MHVEGHHLIGVLERVLHTISMMLVQVHIQHAAVLLSQLADAQHYVINIAETGRSLSLGVVPASEKVDHVLEATAVD